MNLKEYQGTYYKNKEESLGIPKQFTIAVMAVGIVLILLFLLCRGVWMAADWAAPNEKLIPHAKELLQEKGFSVEKIRYLTSTQRSDGGHDIDFDVNGLKKEGVNLGRCLVTFDIYNVFYNKYTDSLKSIVPYDAEIAETYKQYYQVGMGTKGILD